MIRNLEIIKRHSNLISVGPIEKKVYVYKYMTIGTALVCLRNNSLRFSLPTTPYWKDPYESRFYCADYHNLKLGKRDFDRRLFACCVTKNKLSEPAWRMYTDNPKEHCVKFSICIGQLRKYLNLYAKNHNISLYEGSIDYSLTDKDINGLHKKTSYFYNEIFADFQLREYLNLMLVKRHLFIHEGELRYMMLGGDLDFSQDYVYPFIPWSMCLSKVSLNIQDDNDESQLREALQCNSEECQLKYSLPYKPFVPIEIEDIYKPFKKITIEK